MSPKQRKPRSREQERLADTDSFVAASENPTSPRSKRHRHRSENTTAPARKVVRMARAPSTASISRRHRGRMARVVAPPKKRAMARESPVPTTSTAPEAPSEPQPPKKRGRKPKVRTEQVEQTEQTMQAKEGQFKDEPLPMISIFGKVLPGNELIDETMTKFRHCYFSMRVDFYDGILHEELGDEFSAWLNGDSTEMEAKEPPRAHFQFIEPTVDEIAGKADVLVESGASKEKVSIPCTRIESGDALPKMDYFVLIESSIDGRDQPRLSHIPYFDKEQDDKEILKHLTPLFPEGINASKQNLGNINDYMLFELFLKAFDHFKTLPQKTNPDLIYYSIYRLFRSKMSQRELSEAFEDLALRFGGENFDASALEPWKKKDEYKQRMKKKPVMCYQCQHYMCSVHGFEPETEQFSSDYRQVKFPMDSRGKKCSASCYKDLPLLNEYANAAKKEMVGYLSKQQMRSLSLGDGALIVTYFQDFDVKNSFCEFVASILDPELTGSKYTTCKDTFEFLVKFSKLRDKTSDQPSTKKTAAYQFSKHDSAFRKTMVRSEEARKQKIIERKKDDLIAEGADEAKTEKELGELERRLAKEGAGLRAVTPFRGCQHEGPCKSSKDCICSENGMCTFLCKCDKECPQRFPGCRCGPGRCQSKKCQCFLARFECTPDTCKTCHCEDVDESTELRCLNTGMTRMAQKRVQVAPSKIAGNGLFVLEPCKTNEFICEYVGERISDEEAERRGAIYDMMKCSYIFNLETGGAIDSYCVGNLSRFANHSCKNDATVSARTVVVAGEHRIGFYARRDLEAGEELTFNYAYLGEHNKLFVNGQRKRGRKPKE